MTLLLIAALLLSTTGLVLEQEQNTGSSVVLAQPAAGTRYVLNGELEKKKELAQRLLKNRNFAKMELVISELLGQYPYEGELYLLQGEMLMRQQRPVAAMHAYRQAVDLNPDFLDKKTDLFQGKKIKIAIEEAGSAIETGLAKDPQDAHLRTDLKIFYYMKRKLAGSCG